MLGFSKLFIGVLIIAAMIGYGTHNIINFINIVGVYAVLNVIVNVLR